MLQTIAIRGYRSLREVILPLRRLTVVTGANGTGKSSLYRALRLLADCGRGEVIGSLAREGGLQSVLWAGPEQLGGARRTGKAEGTAGGRPVSIELGFASDDFGYLVDLGLRQMAGHNSLFALDPEINARQCSPTRSTERRRQSPSTTGSSTFKSSSAACCAHCVPPNYPTAHCVSCSRPTRSAPHSLLRSWCSTSQGHHCTLTWFGRWRR